MTYMEIIAMGVYLVVVWAFCAVAAGALLWTVGLAGYGVVRTWDWAWHDPQKFGPRPNGRKHGRRVRTVEVKAFKPSGIQRRVFPLM